MLAAVALLLKFVCAVRLPSCCGAGLAEPGDAAGGASVQRSVGGATSGEVRVTAGAPGDGMGEFELRRGIGPEVGMASEENF
ncbi:unnamed protein product [Urochloa humidicola]